jgi:hypothetical protein
MVGILEALSAPFFSRPFQAEPERVHWTDGIVYKLHTWTGTLLFFCRDVTRQT